MPMDHPAVREALVATPPAGYLAAYLAGVDLPHVINVCMAIYTLGLAAKTIWAGLRKLRELWAHRHYYRAKRKIRKARQRTERHAQANGYRVEWP